MHNGGLCLGLGSTDGGDLLKAVPFQQLSVIFLFSVGQRGEGGWENIHASLTSIWAVTAGVDISTGFLGRGHGASVK